MYSIKKLTIGVLAIWAIGGCSAPPNQISTTPTIALYGQNGIGELNCRLPLTTGKHKLQSTNPCRQRFDYNFVIENPREGVDFTFYANEDCDKEASSNLDRGYIQYKIVDPTHGQPTAMTGIDQGRGLPAGTEVNVGIVLVESRVALPPVSGRDKCILVNNSN
ncbi:hypothetical protein [Pseudomonas frederiksbergensis]|uniref:hypothetical protein n=1 Tax=Pseudomonas frederiksbergensis TaxID=104087 RepID=UPI0011CE4893|nr:hypothetical protein [Pseudomonas frederiksbergensis]